MAYAWMDGIDVKSEGYKSGRATFTDTGVSPKQIAAASVRAAFGIWWKYNHEQVAIPKAEAQSNWIKGFRGHFGVGR